MNIANLFSKILKGSKFILIIIVTIVYNRVFVSSFGRVDAANGRSIDYGKIGSSGFCNDNLGVTCYPCAPRGGSFLVCSGCIKIINKTI